MSADPDLPIDELFERCIELEPTARGAFVEELRSRRPEVARELASLLGARAADPSFLASAERPATPELSQLVRALLGGEEAERVVDPLFAPESAGIPRSERYDLRGELGRGGMGVVLRAFDPELEREIALKRMPAFGADARIATPPASARTLGLFLKEARVTAALDHPGVVPVHELGLDAEGRVYFTMRLVRGRELGAVFELARKGAEGWSAARALEALLKVCDAVAYAHSRGVVHRDLKPQNVLVGRFGEVYVMDWGVARTAGARELEHLRPRVESGGAASPLVTEEGDVLGTPAYMSPEQARGEVERVDGRSDVYAIGALLYELLAGRPPYVEPGAPVSSRALLERVRSAAPVPLAALAPDEPAELAAVCEKAMARELGQRYATVEELAADLRAFLDGRVVRAYESGALAELRKWVRRNRGFAIAAAVALVSLVGGLGSTAYVEGRARDAATRTSTQLAELNAELSTRNQELVEERERAQRNADEANRQKQAAEGAVGFLVDLFEAPDPNVARGKEVTAREVLDRGAEKLASSKDLDPLARARLEQAMGSAYQGLDAFEQAEAHFTSALELVRASAGEKSPEALFAANLLGVLKAKRGDVDGAATLFETTYEESRAAFGDDDERTLDAMQNLASARDGQNRWKEALELYTRSVEDRVRVYGAGHGETLLARHTRAILLERMGRYEEARAEFETTLAGLRPLFGEDHPRTLSVEESLATALGGLGDHEGAARLLTQVLAARERIFGPEHTLTVTTIENLAMEIVHLGRGPEALDLIDRAIEVRRRFGEDAPLTILARQNRAFCLTEMDRGSEAYEEQWRVYEDAERALGADDPYTLFALGNLAMAASGREPTEVVDGLFEDDIERHRRVLGAAHPRTLTQLNNYALHLTRTGRGEASLPWYREALEGLQRFDPDHPNTISTECDLAVELTRLGRWSEAEPLARDGLEHTPSDDAYRAVREDLVERIERALAKPDGK